MRDIKGTNGGKKVSQNVLLIYGRTICSSLMLELEWIRCHSTHKKDARDLQLGK